MKKIVLVMFSLLVFQTANANTAFIKNWHLDGGAISCFRISNVSNVDGEVTVTLFSTDGSIYNGPLTDKVLISSLNTPFIVPPQKTARFCTGITGAIHVGYGKIETKTANNLPGKVEFLASGYVQIVSSAGMMQIEITKDATF